jgi:acetoin utilization deacetylase AcuC-like enzyme
MPMKPILFTHDDCDAHRMQDGHPERPERRQAVLRHLRENKGLEGWVIREPGLVSREALDRVHDTTYLDHVFASAPDEGLTPLDADTAMSQGTLRAARLASGALEEAVALVTRGEAERVFCAMRPPGHQPPFSPIRSGPKAASSTPRQKQIPSSTPPGHGRGKTWMKLP